MRNQGCNQNKAKPTEAHVNIKKISNSPSIMRYAIYNTAFSDFSLNLNFIDQSYFRIKSISSN